MEVLSAILAAAAGLMIFLAVIAIVVYVLVAIFLNKFNKLVYGKGTALAWIPICNIYLLGKLSFNKIVGWVVVVCSFLVGTYSTTIDGVTTTKTILPSAIATPFMYIYDIALLGLYIYAIVKYFKLKKQGTTQPVNNVTQAPMNNAAPIEPMKQMNTAPIEPVVQPVNPTPVEPVNTNPSDPNQTNTTL